MLLEGRAFFALIAIIVIFHPVELLRVLHAASEHVPHVLCPTRVFEPMDKQLATARWGRHEHVLVATAVQIGQVVEVVKRDCGKHYAMKVMHKEMMRRCLGSSWRKKINLEKDLMASLNHPFLVNLSYAFQNTEFLVLVMDLVPAGDLSEFVLTKKRLTPAQVHWLA